jgi:hypothetical protein
MSSYYPLEIPRCEHIKDDGVRCGAPALRGKPFCYHHNEVHGKRLKPGQKGYKFRPIETRESVTMQVADIAQAAHDGTISLPLARVLLYSIQISAQQRTKYVACRDVETEIPESMRGSGDRDGEGAEDGADATIPLKPEEGLNGAPTAEGGADGSDEQIRESIFNPDREQVRAHWMQHLPVEIGELRCPSGELVYTSPEWLPLSEEQLAYLRDHLPPDHSHGTEEEQENLRRMSFHFGNCMVKPPRPEEIVESHKKLWEGDAMWKEFDAQIKKSPAKAVELLLGQAGKKTG